MSFFKEKIHKWVLSWPEETLRQMIRLMICNMLFGTESGNLHLDKAQPKKKYQVLDQTPLRDGGSEVNHIPQSSDHML